MASHRRIPPAAFALCILVIACGTKPPAITEPASTEKAAPPQVATPTPAAESTSADAAVPAATAPPLAPAELSCKTVKTDDAPGVCGVLESAPRGDAKAVAKTVEIWKRLEGPFRALSGRETALVVLSPEARMGEGAEAQPLPPAAFICPGAPPTVYVPASLLALVDDKNPKKYPSDFLAFVIGHELGHRMNDLTPDGCQLGAFQRPGKGFEEEELADVRSAFFITSAGFSASKVARDDMVSRFLEAEYALGREDSKSRHDALLGALSQFDGYEALYQVALTVAMSGEMEAADRLLSWADELVQSHGVPLPELRVVRAIARINYAASMAPWQAELNMPVGIEQLRCTAVHPGHSGLWEEPQKRVRGPDIERGRQLLKQALRLLDEAESRGATPFTVATARACAHLYLADASAAAEHQAIAERLHKAAKIPAVARVLGDNRALVDFLTFARKTPAPAFDDLSGLRAWADQLTQAVGARNIPTALAAVVAAVRAPDAYRPSPAADAPVCSKPPAKPNPPFAAVPSTPGPGICPAGYELIHTLPSAAARAKSGSTQGFNVCRRVADGIEWVRVSLASTTEPPLAALEQQMLMVRAPAGLTTISDWACQCASVERQGISDRGETVYRASCPALAVEAAALVVSSERVDQVVQFSP